MAPGSEISVNISNNEIDSSVKMRIYVPLWCSYHVHAHNPQSLESLVLRVQQGGLAGNLCQRALYPKKQVQAQLSVLLLTCPKDNKFDMILI